MPTLHQYGIKNQQPIVSVDLKITFSCIFMWHDYCKGNPALLAMQQNAPKINS